MSNESEIIPYEESPLPAARGVIVFAPHPDDEIFGCGGALARHAQAGHSVQVVLVTSGEYQARDDARSDYAATRLKESAQAAQILGLPAPLAWDLPDRAVMYGEALVERISRAILDAQADVVYAPSPWELHPDHRAVAMAAIESVRRITENISLFLYEVSAPLRPNVLLDITSVWNVKQQAMRAFRSQEESLPYASFISGLNRFRALTLFPAAEYAEAFEKYESTDLRGGAALSIESERDRLLMRGTAVLPQDAPWVSVIVRTMGRPTLSKALASIERQTYAHIETVLVDAAGQGFDAMVHNATSVKYVSAGVPLGRAQAANAGMNAASGDYFIFLDDDDWFYPDHIAKLVLAVRQNGHVKAVHTAIECVDAVGQATGEVFDFPYGAGELRFGNFLPIHSVLFHRSLWESRCKFDANFDLYEDWDFWLQVEARTSFGFVEGVSAAYRIHPGAGEGVSVNPSRARKATDRLYAKWEVLSTEDTFSDLITRSLAARQTRRELQQQRKHSSHLQKLLEFQRERAMDALRDADAARQDAHHLGAAHDQACAARDAAYADLANTHAQLAAVTAAQAESLHSNQVLNAELQQTKTDLLLAREHAENMDGALKLTALALESARADIDAIHSSTSWRMSRPLRQIGQRLRNFRDGLKVISVAQGKGLGWVDLARETRKTFRSEGVAGVRRRARRMLVSQDGRSSEPAMAGAGPARADAERSYAHWVTAYDVLGKEQLDKLAKEADRLHPKPLVSVVMPVYNPQHEDLQRAIASVQAQLYPHWELCICDDASSDPEIRKILENAARDDSRLRLCFHTENQHISHATNAALKIAQGQYMAFLDQDDELRPHALLLAVKMFAQNPQLQLLYSDEDKIDSHGLRFDPYFKPDFNLGLLRSHNYMCHFAVYERELLERLGGLRPGFEGAQDYDLALRAVDSVAAQAVGHVPAILYHWRTAKGSTASGHSNKNYAFEAGRRALTEHLQRRGLHGQVQEAPEAKGMYRILWQRPEPAPLVSIVIPTRNGHQILRQCLDSMVQTHYPNYEIIVVDNGSDEAETLNLLQERSETGQIRVLRDDRPFNFSALNNLAVQTAARGEFVLMLNNDIEITDPHWLDELVGPAMEPGVGCVGARLWYPDGRLQHGGVVLVCGVAGHAHKFLPKGEHGYMGRAVLSQDMVAVTAACLLVRSSIFKEVGGLDETLAVAFNDVDFCLRVFQAGYRNHWTPYAQLIHHESLSRGYENTPAKQMRFRGEVETLQQRWAHLLDHDPCYNPNLTVNAEDFSLAWPPRINV